MKKINIRKHLKLFPQKKHLYQKTTRNNYEIPHINEETEHEVGHENAKVSEEYKTMKILQQVTKISIFLPIDGSHVQTSQVLRIKKLLAQYGVPINDEGDLGWRASVAGRHARWQHAIAKQSALKSFRWLLVVLWCARRRDLTTNKR